MGQTTPKQTLEQQYRIEKIERDGCVLLSHIQTQQEYKLRNHCSNIEDQILGLEQLVGKREHIKSKHLLELVQRKRTSQKQICSVIHKLHLLVQYPFKTLHHELHQRKPQYQYFSEDELWSILYSCCVGLNLLYSNKLNHECLSSSQIFINKEGLIKISDPLLLGLQKNYVTILKEMKVEGCHISPELMNFLDDCSFSFYDKQLSDVFILGTIMLEISLLSKIELYDHEHRRPKLQNLPVYLDEVRKRYSSNYAQVLKKMLQLHSRYRMRFGCIISKIQQQNTELEQTATNSVQLQEKTHRSFQSTQPKVKFTYHSAPGGEVLYSDDIPQIRQILESYRNR